MRELESAFAARFKQVQQAVLPWKVMSSGTGLCKLLLIWEQTALVDWLSE